MATKIRVNTGSSAGFRQLGTKSLPRRDQNYCNLDPWQLTSVKIEFKCTNVLLTHWSRVTHLCVSKLSILGSDNGLSPRRRQDFLNQYWDIVNLTLGNKLQWNLNRNLIYFHSRKCIWKCRLENGDHLSPPQCVTGTISKCRLQNDGNLFEPLCVNRRLGIETLFDICASGKWSNAIH